MTQQQEINLEKNELLFAAYDAMIKAANINNVPFAELCEMMITLHGIKTKTN